MAATWTIGLESGQMHTLADLNISDLKITFRNRAADEARFRIDGDYTTAAAGFAYGNTYKIAKNGIVVYRGRCERIVRHGSGASQYANVVLLGGWHWLTLKMLQQNWPMGSSGTPTAKSRVILGAKYNASTGENEMVPASSQLSDIIAASPSAISRGTIAVSNRHIPLDERVDSTCAEAIDAILSWWPDAVVYFRYDSGTQINIKRIPSLPPKTIPLASLAEEVEITARNDLLVPGVKLVYETIDENGCQNVHVDSRNAGNADALGGVVNTISVGGASPGGWDITSVKITSERLPDPLTAAWWAARIPQLAGWDDVTLHGPGDTVTLSDGTEVPGRTVTLSDGTVATTWPPRMGTKTLHSELLGGTVEPWMKEKMDRVRIQQYVDYTLNGQVVENALLTIEMTLTSAETKIYQTGTVAPPPEDHPAADGLAGEIHEAVGKLYYEGSVVQIGEDPPELAAVGEKLNLSGGAAEWTHMDTPVQSVEWDVGRGQTRVSFGPPNQVGKQDHVARARANRTRGPARSCGVMGRASTADEAVSTGATGSVNTSAGGGIPAKITVKSQSSPDKMELDACADEFLGPAIKILSWLRNLELYGSRILMNDTWNEEEVLVSCGGEGGDNVQEEGEEADDGVFRPLYPVLRLKSSQSYAQLGFELDMADDGDGDGEGNNEVNGGGEARGRDVGDGMKSGESAPESQDNDPALKLSNGGNTYALLKSTGLTLHASNGNCSISADGIEFDDGTRITSAGKTHTLDVVTHVSQNGAGTINVSKTRLYFTGGLLTGLQNL